MRILFFIVAVMAMLVFSAPVWASLPHYNRDLGYTIWLPANWREASPGSLDGSRSPLPVLGDSPDWATGYYSPAGDQGPVLLVEIKHGRKMPSADIVNFNRFIIRSMSADRRHGASRLKEARYIRDKKTLRLVAEAKVGGKDMLSLSYVVYTRKGMLTFVGYVEPGDDAMRSAIDKAVLSLYLDDHIRYESSLTVREQGAYGVATP